jgi:hypothetical protein
MAGRSGLVRLLLRTVVPLRGMLCLRRVVIGHVRLALVAPDAAGRILAVRDHLAISTDHEGSYICAA